MRDTSALPLLNQQGKDRAPGLVWAFAGSRDAPAVRLASDEIPDALRARDWVWLHVDLVDQRVLGWLSEVCGLPLSAEAVLSGQGGLAFQNERGSVSGTCPDFYVDFARVTSSVGKLVFTVSEKIVVTGRRHPLAHVERMRRDLADGRRIATAFDVIVGITAGFCEAAALKLREVEAELDGLEDRLLEAAVFDDRDAVKGVRRLALALRRPVSATVVHFREAARRGAADLPESGQEAIAEIVSRMASLDDYVAQLAERAKLLQDEMAAEMHDDSNRSLRALTVMSALLMPGTLVVGIFGMNVAGLPFLESPLGFVGAMALAVSATVLFYRALVRAGASLRL